MTLKFEGEPDAEKKARMLEVYRQNRDEIRASIKALSAIHGAPAVCVALHMVNLKSIAIACDMPQEARGHFVSQAQALVEHWCDASQTETKRVRDIAEGLWSQSCILKASMEEAGIPSMVIMTGEQTGD